MTPPVHSVAVETLANSISVKSRIRQWLAPAILAVTDYIMVVSAFLIALFLRTNVIPRYVHGLQAFTIEENWLLVLIPFIYLGFLAYERLYTKRLPFWQSAEAIFKVCIYATAFTVVLMYLAGEIRHVSRIFIAIGCALSYLYLLVGRYLIKRLLVTIGLWEKPVIIIGAGKTAELLAKAFEDEPNMGYKIVGLIEDNYVQRKLIQRYPLLGNFANAEKTVAYNGIRDVIIAAPGIDREDLLQLIYKIQPLVDNVSIVPNLFGVPMGNMEAEVFLNQNTVLLHMRNNMSSVTNKILKRCFDVSLSIIGLIFITPILLVIALLIYLDSPGPLIFAHKRVGKNGQPFYCYKFRSMIMNSQEVLEDHLQQNPAARAEWEQDFKLRDDPRITKLGKFIRKTSIDELPQLFNVIKGEMSLVGPRPIIHKEIPKYGEYINDYCLTHPGITGYWQVSGRNDVDYDSRVRMDSWYVRNWSVWLDIVLLIKTVNVVLARKGAY